MNIAPDLELPLDIITESTAVLGRRGSGKTHTASVLVEEFLGAGQQVIILDPLDVWHGLRTSANGKCPGFPLVIFGGQKSEIDLDSASPSAIAEVLVETRNSAIISLRELSKGKAKAFVGEFLERLYECKASADRRTPLSLVIDEADAFVPQRVTPDVARSYGAVDTIVRRGRVSGFGTVLISQRAAVIAKDVLTQTEVLICHQTTGPQDRRALEDWVEQHDDEGRRAEFMGSLASLQRGEAWVWSPAALGLFRRVQVRARMTFDSSSTPKVGEVPVIATVAAELPIEKLVSMLGTLEERKKPTDPNAKAVPLSAAERLELEGLRRRTLELEQELVETNARLAAIRAFVDQNTLPPLVSLETEVELDNIVVSPVSMDPDIFHPARKTVGPPAKFSAQPKLATDDGLSKCARALLTALLQHGTMTLVQAAICAGYAPDSGGVRNAAGELRSNGFVEGTNVGGLTATTVGRSAFGHMPPLPSGKKLLEHWLAKLGKAEREILSVVVSAYPKGVSLRTAAEKCGYSPGSGGVRNAAGKLRTLALVTGSNAGMTANERLVR